MNEEKRPIDNAEEVTGGEGVTDGLIVSDRGENLATERGANIERD